MTNRPVFPLGEWTFGNGFASFMPEGIWICSYTSFSEAVFNSLLFVFTDIGTELIV